MRRVGSGYGSAPSKAFGHPMAAIDWLISVYLWKSLAAAGFILAFGLVTPISTHPSASRWNTTDDGFDMEIRALARLQDDDWYPKLSSSPWTRSIFIFLWGDLYSHITSYGGCLHRTLGKYYLAELLLAIQGIHKAGIIHRDLKPNLWAEMERLVQLRRGYYSMAIVYHEMVTGWVPYHIEIQKPEPGAREPKAVLDLGRKRLTSNLSPWRTLNF
ncbi:hypothetical protein BJ912DRAFT_1056518 [Pholiota molesta]|nr:hypothetical protein BJ912DRAFT_1056518 [Pholiota molesta]